MSDVTIRDLVPLVKKGQAPAVVFNSTCVETGQRVGISPVHLEVSHDKAQAAVVEEAHHYVARPIDFISWYSSALDGSQADLRISTAARLSATFAYVAPAASPALNPASGGKWKQGFSDRQRLHYCDGGYSDNAGLVTLVKMLRDLLQSYRQSGQKPPFERVLVVRIEPFAPDEVSLRDANGGFNSEFFGPAQALDASRVSTRAERGELELDLLQAASNPNYSFRRGITRVYQMVGLVGSTIPFADKRSSRAVIEIESKLKGLVSSRMGSDPATIKDDASRFASILEGPIRELEGLRGIEEEHKDRLTQLSRNLKHAKEAAIQFGKSAGVPASRGFSIESITFRFPQAPVDGVQPPLSWTLSKRQRRAISDGWDKLSDALNQDAKDPNDEKAPTDGPNLGSDSVTTLKELRKMFGRASKPAVEP